MAPAIGTVADLERFVEQVLPSNGKVQQTGEAFGRVVGPVHMDVDAAGTVCHGSLLDQRSDNVLQVLDVIILEDGSDNLAGILLVGRDDLTAALFLTTDAAVTHGLPGAALAVTSVVGVVGGADVARGLAEVFCDGSGCGGTGDAGQLNLDAEILILNRGAHDMFLLGVSEDAPLPGCQDGVKVILFDDLLDELLHGLFGLEALTLRDNAVALVELLPNDFLHGIPS